jgi:ATP-dependent helicase HrpA
VRQVADILGKAGQVRVRLAEATELAVLNSVTDAKAHLDRLLAPGFVTACGTARLADLARYVQAEAYRAERLGSTRAREQQSIWLMDQLTQEYEEAVSALAPAASLPGLGAPGRAVRLRRQAGGPVWVAVPKALAEVPWMLEEMRVSLFAQGLGTAYPISEKRIRKALNEVAAAPVTP